MFTTNAIETFQHFSSVRRLPSLIINRKFIIKQGNRPVDHKIIKDDNEIKKNGNV